MNKKRDYFVITRGNYKYVLFEVNRIDKDQRADFMNSGMALCAVICRGENLEDIKAIMKQRKHERRVL